VNGGVRGALAWGLFVVASTQLPAGAVGERGGGGGLRRELAEKVVRWYWPGHKWRDMVGVFEGFVVNESCLETWRVLWERTVEDISRRDLCDVVEP
jgi:hypothetical protein